jgi:hypothetical protein
MCSLDFQGSASQCQSVSGHTAVVMFRVNIIQKQNTKQLQYMMLLNPESRITHQTQAINIKTENFQPE